MEIAKAYRSIIMGPRRGNLGRGACFWDSDGKIGNYNRSRFSLVEVFTETSTHAPLQLFFDGIRHSPYHIMLWYTTTIYMYTHTDAHIKQARGADRFQRSPFPVWMIPFRCSSHKNGIRTRSSTSQSSQRRPIYTYIYRTPATCKRSIETVQLFARGRTNDASQQEGEEECLLYKAESDDGLILASMMA